MFKQSATESSDDYFVDERALEIESSRIDDPFIQLAIAEEDDLDTLENMTFDEYLNHL